MDKLKYYLDSIKIEYSNAVRKFPKFNSEHEGYAVIKEEVDELWDDIKNNKNTSLKDREKETIQIGAMALRYLMDLCIEEQEIDNG